MNGYFWIYLVMLCFVLWHCVTDDREQKRLIYFGSWGFLMLMFVCQEYEVSTDIAEYFTQYDIIPSLSLGEMFTHKFEPGYVLLCRMVDAVFHSERVLVLLVGLLILLPFARSYEKETDCPMVAVMCFLALGLYVQAISFWRQFIAMAILTFSYRFVRERKLLPFLLCILAAMLFHKVSAIFVVMYFVYPIPLKNWTVLLCAAASAALWLVGPAVIDFCIKTFYPLYALLPRYENEGFVLFAVLWILVLLAYWLLQDKLEDGKFRVSFQMLLIAATLQPGCFHFRFWQRLVLFFLPALVPVTTALYAEVFHNPENRLLTLLQRFAPRLHSAVISVYDRKWFRIAILIAMFAVLFFWYLSEINGVVYTMASVR